MIFCLSFGAQSAFSAAEEEEVFLSKHFLEMEDVQKKFWLDGAISALVHVAAAKNEDQGRCVYGWYFSDDIAEKNGLILASMQKYQNAPPTAVLLALTERECGEYRK